MKTLRLPSVFLMCITAMLVSSCASKKTTPPLTQAEKIDSLQEGRTTDEEVRIIFGIPDASLTRGKTRTWVYLDEKDSKEKTYQLPNGIHEGRGVIISFDAAGVLKEHKEVNAEQLQEMQEKSESKPEASLAESKNQDPLPASQ